MFTSCLLSYLTSFQAPDYFLGSVNLKPVVFLPVLLFVFYLPHFSLLSFFSTHPLFWQEVKEGINAVPLSTCLNHVTEKYKILVGLYILAGGIRTEQVGICRAVLLPQDPCKAPPELSHLFYARST